MKKKRVESSLKSEILMKEKKMISKKTQDFYSFFTSLFSILPRL